MKDNNKNQKTTHLLSGDCFFLATLKIERFSAKPLYFSFQEWHKCKCPRGREQREGKTNILLFVSNGLFCVFLKFYVFHQEKDLILMTFLKKGPLGVCLGGPLRGNIKVHHQTSNASAIFSLGAVFFSDPIELLAFHLKLFSDFLMESLFCSQLI